MANYYMKMRLDIFENPDYIDLFSTKKNYLELWLRLIKVCVEANDDGFLTHREGKPWSVDHLLRRFSIKRRSLSSFLCRCFELGLIEVDHNYDQIDDFLDGNGTLRIVDWTEWYGREKSPSTARVRASRARAKSKSDPETDRPKPSAEVLHETLHVTPVKQNETHIAEQSRERADREREQTAEGKVLHCNNSDSAAAAFFGENEFLKIADEAHRSLTGQPLSKSSHKTTLKLAANLPESPHGWRDRAGATLIAAQRISHAMANGESVAKPWGFLLTVLGDHLAAATSCNKLADIQGTDPDYLWAPQKEQKR